MDPHTLEPLQEVFSIATGNATNALSKMTGQTVVFAVPRVQAMGIEAVSAALGPAAQLLSASMVKLTGDANGIILLSLDPHGAEALTADVITEQTGGAYKDLDQSVLREMVNIVGGTALSALGQFLHMRLFQSVPASTTDMSGAILDPFMAELGASFDKVLVFQADCTIPAKGAKLQLLILIDPPSTTTMLQKIAEKVSPPHATDN